MHCPRAPRSWFFLDQVQPTPPRAVGLFLYAPHSSCSNCWHYLSGPIAFALWPSFWLCHCWQSHWVTYFWVSVFPSVRTMPAHQSCEDLLSPCLWNHCENCKLLCICRESITSFCKCKLHSPTHLRPRKWPAHVHIGISKCPDLLMLSNANWCVLSPSSAGYSQYTVEFGILSSTSIFIKITGKWWSLAHSGESEEQKLRNPP